MKRILLFFITLLFITCLIVFGYRYCTNHFSFIENRYYEKTGFKGTYDFQNIIRQKGRPKSDEIVENEGLSRRVIKYDGYTFISNSRIDGTAGEYLAVTEITDPKYKIGLFRVGVGSSKKKIQSVYRYCQKIQGLYANQVGFIDNYLWIVFSLGENECITKIEFYQGP